MTESEQSHVSLLIDFENLVIPFEEKAGYEAGSIKLQPVIDFLEENFGNASCCGRSSRISRSSAATATSDRS
jgi:hypothetical protein